MTTYLTAWAVCATAASFVVLGVVVALEIRDHHRTKKIADLMPAPRRIRPRSAAAIVRVNDPAAFEEFLAELIVTPHVEAALS